MLNWASPGYFHTLGIPLLRGRDFGWADTVGTAPVAIVNEKLAKQYFGKEDPIGKHVTPVATYAGSDKPKARQIIAVVGNASHFFLEAEVQPEVYMPQLQDGLPDATIVVRSHLPVGMVESEIRAAVSAIDPRLSLGPIQTVSDLMELQLAWRKFIARIGVVFAAAALLFAAVGLYAVLAFSVAQRRRELAIRKALGASPWALAALILRRGLVMSSLGVVTGVAMSLAVAKLLSSMLYGVVAADPVAIVGATAILLFVSLFASTWPARKAIRGDIGIVMRAE